MDFQNLATSVSFSFQNLWSGLLGAIPSILGAAVVFIIGLIVASGLGALVERLIRVFKLDDVLKKLGVSEYIERAGLKADSGKFFGKLVYWFVIIAFFLAASDILRFTELSNFLREVLLYIPNVIIAILILLAAVVVANFLRGAVKASVQGARLHSAKFLAGLTWWSIFVFGLLAALVQLGIAASIINTLITGIIAMIALAGGLAFGLGGREYASKLLEKMREGIENRD